ncbi:hypothetical protein [Empedobacter sp. GD03739]|uniref:hypothetical protein n=1 Tax=Empedobacter sp. GD03739 TaxID=2975376 RepID=UPI002447C705|nr:hypothetical protein [Empedobacter sp. GD03739]MDH1601902.1 hypothetical protein [Empedobacter sp. GD03739]
MNTKMHLKQSLIFGIIGLIITIPLIAMQFTNEVNWSLFDFIIAFILLSVIGLTINYILQLTNRLQNKIFFCIMVLLIGLLIWTELAVGVFGSPIAGN